ncbi:hypothetical protein J3R83DRAFT_7521 [Lanmaoa asiatica]|nr:hypothetical protein J3R83DRAFT_7777 [Lanmaoa asiatica]KAH0826035.1 hypothetical protein J3R83DRAFT_7521 [Lanmaoa asiatica]
MVTEITPDGKARHLGTRADWVFWPERSKTGHSVYVVPDPEDVRPPEHDAAWPSGCPNRPVIRIEHEGASCWSLDWTNSEVIAVGLMNGKAAKPLVGHRISHLIVTSKRADTAADTLPTHFIAVHQSVIRALAWIRVPPTDGSDVPNLFEDPMVIASRGYDGVECLTDIREPHGNLVNRTRGMSPCHESAFPCFEHTLSSTDVIDSATYSMFATGPIMINHDNSVKSSSVSPSVLGRGRVLMEPDGPVWSVSVSDYHPQLAVGSVDGSCTTTKTQIDTAGRRRCASNVHLPSNATHVDPNICSQPFLVHKIYQLDYSRKTDEFRMLEYFLPQEMQKKTTSAKGKAHGKDKNKDKQDTDADAETKGHSTDTDVWPPEIGMEQWQRSRGRTAVGLGDSVGALSHRLAVGEMDQG